VLFKKQIGNLNTGQLDTIADSQLLCDRWTASSALQKSIRRGDAELAQRAACTLYGSDRNTVWRRLIVIACEDIGADDLDVLLEIFQAATSIELRRQYGEAVVIAAVVRRLAEAVKDRSADYLACAASDHPDLNAVRRFCKGTSLEKRLDLVSDVSQPLARRAVEAWYASGINPRYQNEVRGGDIHALADRYRSLGAAEELAYSVVLAAKRAREVLVVLTPLVWLEVQRSGSVSARCDPVPQAKAIAGVPLYAFDTHTRIGKRAIERLVSENKALRDWETMWWLRQRRLMTAVARRVPATSTADSSRNQTIDQTSIPRSSSPWRTSGST
jgi:hypothetical protein